ncbi:hypothetical protein JQ567_22935 [Bradyrhizobium sp. AUGA SZCCT0431]|nr:hypothetical protein [Bradyrhizobium sp. AUGA SZCCT0431]
MDLESVRREIEHMRVQSGRQRKEILQLQRAGIPTASAELLLLRMQDKIDQLCIKREELKKEMPVERRVLGGRKW